MRIELEKTSCKIITPKIYSDKRGYFFESYNKEELKTVYDIDTDFVQDNESFSKKNVLRGLHYQVPPHGQAKLVRVTQGKVLDIAVDIRPDSVTFGNYYSVILSAKNKKQLFIPTGYAHGFVVLSDEPGFAISVITFTIRNLKEGLDGMILT